MRSPLAAFAALIMLLGFGLVGAVLLGIGRKQAAIDKGKLTSQPLGEGTVSHELASRPAVSRFSREDLGQHALWIEESGGGWILLVQARDGVNPYAVIYGVDVPRPVLDGGRVLFPIDEHLSVELMTSGRGKSYYACDRGLLELNEPRELGQVLAELEQLDGERDAVSVAARVWPRLLPLVK